MTEEPVPAVARIEHIEEAGKVFRMRSTRVTSTDWSACLSLMRCLFRILEKSFPAPMLFGKRSLVSWRPEHGSKESSYLAFIGWEISLWRRPNGRWRATMLTVIR